MGNTNTSSKLTRFFNQTVLPLFLLVCCPPAVILIWYTNMELGGSFMELYEFFELNGFFAGIYEVWSPVFWGSGTAWAILGIFAAIQLAFMRIIPGKTDFGPKTPGGHVPEYKDNGPLTFVITMALFAVLGLWLKVFDPAIIYDHFGEILGALTVFAWGFCLLLYFKGLYAPSGPDHGSSGNPIFDYYWGTELYPRILGWDIKQFTNCRIGMMAWPILLLSYAAAQYKYQGQLSDSMIVAVGLQLVYITKFFIWETGYLKSMDIQVDRAGFYICWGCLVWLPMVYTSHSHYLVSHPNQLGIPLALAIYVAGTAMILLNYLADWQRQAFRASGGKTLIWGKIPVTIRAKYTDHEGRKQESLLLASGWWGISRHFHYIPEILGAFFWTLPALFDNSLPWFYVVFLTILLVHRAFRDDKRCSEKYGKYWDEYKEKVRWKIIPGIL